MALQPFEWRDKPSLIEHLFPVQKISAETFKERMASHGQLLVSLGAFWKGRKPLILNKACILGSLLPATDNPLEDLEVFELLMGIDSESMQKRIEASLPASKQETIGDYLVLPYAEQIRIAKRPEEIDESLFVHIWNRVNNHLGTSAHTFAQLVEELGVARFGHRPRVADVFSGSGQIPFEAARLGCDVYASDLNPISCMLTWGALNVVGASAQKRVEIDKAQRDIVKKVQKEIDELDIESDGRGWRAKVFLYCVEVTCPESGWRVPLIPSLIISNSFRVVAELKPVPAERRYDISIREVSTDEELEFYKSGTIQDGEVIHSPDGKTQYRVNIKTIRGDYKEGKENLNKLRMWEKTDFAPRPDDIFQDRLFCVQWMKKKPKGSQYYYEFRTVTNDDLKTRKKGNRTCRIQIR
ncbi:probable predicted DNA methylase containing a Zn-ribbon [Escherichia coli ISC7]|uniref:Probable predicted DNA methylase containing a Zn-ribbon n=1 Tax=Escherichia coli ISC7 TaxID=1432555 RepID=W1FA97_ECOLX|nr:probable predicted DNA methylase containing a Zn-ribbon [Escherichia coli ISC7]